MMPSDPIRMEPTMRWFGPNDTVELAAIRQAGATGVVTALHQIPVGEVWTVDAIRDRQLEVEAAGLAWTVIESLPVPDDIKRQSGDWRTKTSPDAFCSDTTTKFLSGKATVSQTGKRH